MTRPLPTSLLVLILSVPLLPLSAQTPADSPPATPPSAATTTAPPTALSTILGPALESLKQTLATLRPDKWKAPGTVTAEQVADIASIQRDLDTTLPPLLSAADASPGSVPTLLPAYRNVEALYDVVVRVAQTSILAAPAPQSAALQQTVASLQQGRRAVGDQMQSAAQSQDRQLIAVRAQLHTLQVTPPPPAPACPPPPAPVKKATKPRPKPAAKPAATTPPQSSTPTPQ